MSDTLNWSSVTLAALDAKLATAAAQYAALGGILRGRLVNAGTVADLCLAPATNLIAEDAAHVAWRSTYATALAQLDAIGAAIDGGPATTISSTDPLAATGTVRSRLEAASKATHALATVAGDAFAQEFRQLPTEPPYHPSGYYSRPPATVHGFDTLGAVEVHLRALIAEAAAYIAFLP